MAKSVKIDSLPEFLTALAKSGLLSDAQLNKVRQKFEANGIAPLDAARLLVKHQLLTKWQASQLLAGFHRFRLGKFTLCDQLGRSELGTVYLAQHAKLGKQVAVKTLSSKFASQPQIVERFLQEARAAAALDHPNLVQIQDVVSEGDRHLVVMEYVQGQDLQRRVDEQGPLAAEEAVALIRQAAEGLKYAHSQGVIHRDIKPANLLVDDAGIVKLLDTGVGQLRSAAANSQESTGEIMLSAISFVSPEQARGREVDARSDIYSLGGTLYFLLSGRVPYSATTDEERAAIRQTKRPVPLATFRPELPAGLVELCDRMTALKPSERLGSMDDVIAALQPFAPATDEPTLDDMLQEDAEGDGELTLEAVFDELEDEAFEDEPAQEAADEDVAAEDSDAESDKDELSAIGKASDTQRGDDTAAFDWSPKGGGEKKADAPAGFQIKTGASKPVVNPTGFQIKTKRRSAKSDPKASPAASDAKANGDEAVEPAAVAPKVAAAPAAKPKKTPAAPKKPAAAVKPQKTAPASEPNAEAAESDAATPAAAADQPTKSKRWLWVVLGIAAVGLMVFVGGGVLVAALVFSSLRDVTVAEASGEAEAESADEIVEEPATEVDPEDIPYEVEIVGEEQPDAASDTPAAPVPATDMAASDQPAATAETPAAIDVAATPADTAPADTAPADTAPVDKAPAEAPAAAPGTDAVAAATPAASAEAATPAADPAPATPAPTDAAAAPATTTETPAPTPTPEPAPEPKPPAKPPAKPKPQPSALVFEPHVELPPLEETGPAAPQSLGKINIGPSDLCFIVLAGGDMAVRGRSSFEARNAQSGTAPRDWELVLKDNTQESVVATLALPENELLFQWTNAAAENSAAAALRNCSLKITAGSEKPVVLPLRKPVSEEGMTIDMTKPSTEGRWAIDALPDPGAVKIEASLAGQPFVLDPPQPMEAAKGVQWVFVGQQKEEAVVAFKLESSVSARGLEITVRPHVVIPGASPEPLNKATFRKIESQLAINAKRFAEVEAMREQIKKLPQNQRPQAEQFLQVKQQEVEAMSKAAERLGQLEQVTTGLNGAKLNVKVLYKPLDGDVVLLETS